MSSHTLRNDDRGHLHLMLPLLILVAVGGISYAAVRIHNDRTKTSTSSSVTVPTHITSQQDVQKAAAALKSDQTAAQLDPNQLNDDLNSLL